MQKIFHLCGCEWLGAAIKNDKIIPIFFHLRYNDSVALLTAGTEECLG